MTHRPGNSENPNAAVLRRAMAAITALDIDAVKSCLHDDLVMELPYESAVPNLDKAGFATLLEMMFRLYRQFSIAITHIYGVTFRLMRAGSRMSSHTSWPASTSTFVL